MAASDTRRAEAREQGFFTRHLQDADPEVWGAVQNELHRQQNEIELIASENIVSQAVLDAAGTLLTFAWRRLRSSSKKKSKRSEPVAQAPVVVNVVPKGATFVATVGVAVWAGVKIFEIYNRMNGGTEPTKPAVVTPIESERRTGS